MWALKFVPDWIFYGMVGVGIAGVILSRLIPIYYRAAIQAVFAAFVVIGLFMSGAVYSSRDWLERVKEMEAKVKAAEEQSKEENIKIETKVINKTQIIRERGEDIIKYVDREIVKYDSQCVIPKEFVQAHNKAAEQPK